MKLWLLSVGSGMMFGGLLSSIQGANSLPFLIVGAALFLGGILSKRKT